MKHKKIQDFEAEKDEDGKLENVNSPIMKQLIRPLTSKPKVKSKTSRKEVELREKK